VLVLTVGWQLPGQADAADAAKQGNGEIQQVGLRTGVVELAGHGLPEKAAEQGWALEGFHRIVVGAQQFLELVGANR
jgi:hypothetical protein